MKTVLLTSGFNEMSQLYDLLPGEPMAIIEISDRRASLKYAVRGLLQKLAPRRFPDVKSFCKKTGLSYFTVHKSDKQALPAMLKSVSADLVITFRCPMIPVKYLSGLTHGAINLHAALLPNYRGGDPLFWQVLHDLDTIGVTVHRLTDGMDEGPVLIQREFKRPKFRSEKELAYIVNGIHGFHALHSAMEDIMAGADVSEPQTNTNNVKLSTAPNGSRENWRDHLDSSTLSASRIKDIESFLG